MKKIPRIAKFYSVLETIRFIRVRFNGVPLYVKMEPVNIELRLFVTDMEVLQHSEYWFSRFVSLLQHQGFFYNCIILRNNMIKYVINLRHFSKYLG